MASQSRAQAALDESYKPRLPQLVAQGNLAQSTDILVQAPDANKAVLRIEQGTLPFWGAEWKLGNQRALEAESARTAVVESRQDVELLVKQLYFEILRDTDSIQSLDRVERELQKLLATVAPRFQIGRAPSFDLVKVKAAIYDLARTREVAQSQLVGEKSQLAQVIGLKNLDFDLQRMTAVPGLPSEAATGNLSANPTLLGLEQDIQASEAAVSVARSARLPTLGASVEYGYVGIAPDQMVPAWNFMAQLRFTFFDWGLNSSQVAGARAAALVSEKKRDAETQRIRSDLAQTRVLAEAHLADQKRVAALLPELYRTAEISIDRYRRAALGILEVSDAVNLWLQNLLNERAAYYAYLSDLAHLERISGERLRVNYGG